MKYFLYFLVLIFPFGQLFRWEVWGAEVAIHINDFVVGVTVVFWLVVSRKYLAGLGKHWLIKPLVLWIGMMTFSLVMNISQLASREFVVSSLYLFRWTTYALLYFIILEQPELVKKRILRLLIVAGTVVTVSGLFQYILLPNVAFLSAQNWDDHYYRLIGTYLDPGFTGAILILFLILTWEKGNFLERRILGTLSYLAMALTYSRASYLMFIFGAGMSSWFRRNPRIILLASALMLATIIFLPVHAGEGSKLGREYSFWSRVNNWKQSLTIWQESPVWGVGFNSYRYQLRDIGILSKEGVSQSHGGGADSSIMLVLATTGVLGLLAYLNLGLVILFKRKNLLIWASLLGIFVHSWFNNTLFYPWVMEWLWILLAIS